MTILTLGINHRTAAVAVRERVAFAPERLIDALHQAQREAQVSEVAILSTCNRTEVYAALEVEFCEHKGDRCQPLLQWLSGYHQLQLNALSESTYAYQQDAAVKHMMRVASGLDSMVLGEPQIFGQLKTAYHQALTANTLGPQLGRLFQSAFSVAKKVRTETGIGTNPVSIAYAAVSLAKRIFADLSQNTALLIGAGETVELVARHLSEQGVANIIVANRTLGRAETLAQQFSGRAITLRQIQEVLPQADIVIASTASPVPVLGKGTVEQALKKRRYNPMFMMDIAVPRDIEEQVADLPDVYLYTVDDLQQVVAENRKQREDAAVEAEAIVNQQAQRFMDSLRGLEAVDVIKAFRQQIEAMRQQELEKALQAVERGENAAAVIERMGRALANKIIHQPTVQLKKAGEAGDFDKLQWAGDLLGVSAGLPAAEQQPSSNDNNEANT